MATQPQIPTIPGNSIWDYYQPAGKTGMTSGGAGGYDDPYNLYLSQVPIWQQNAKRGVQDALAQAGFGGNRYSSFAGQAAGQIGADTALQMNSMLGNLLYNQTNADKDRALGAAGMGLQAGGMVEQALGNRYGAYSGALGDRLKAWEAQRANQMAALQARYADFERNKYGTLPMLMGALTNSIGQGPEPIIKTDPGSQGYGGMALDLATLFKLFS